MLSRTYSLMFFLLSLEPLTQSPAELHTIMVPKKKTVERTAASSRPKRTPKPTTTATTSAPAPKPKKKTTAIKKAAPKKSATTAKVTKKAAPKKAAAKMAATKKAAPKKAAPKTAAPKYESGLLKLMAATHWALQPRQRSMLEGQRKGSAKRYTARSVPATLFNSWTN
jgi:outer membrane biosynthesis protein TonB